jgi:hypothetical protein
VDKKYSGNSKSDTFRVFFFHLKSKQERKSSIIKAPVTGHTNTLHMNVDDTLKNNEKVNGTSKNTASIVTEEKIKKDEPVVQNSKETDLMDFFNTPSVSTNTNTAVQPKEEVKSKTLNLDDLFAPSTSFQPTKPVTNVQPLTNNWNTQPTTQTMTNSWNNQPTTQQPLSWDQPKTTNQWSTVQQTSSSNPFDDFNQPSMNTTKPQPVNSWNQPSSSNPFDAEDAFQPTTKPVSTQPIMNQPMNNSWNTQPMTQPMNKSWNTQPQSNQWNQPKPEVKKDLFEDFTQFDTFKKIQPKKSEPVNSMSGSFNNVTPTINAPVQNNSPYVAPVVNGNSFGKVNSGNSFGNSNINSTPYVAPVVNGNSFGKVNSGTSFQPVQNNTPYVAPVINGNSFGKVNSGNQNINSTPFVAPVVNGNSFGKVNSGNVNTAPVQNKQSSPFDEDDFFGNNSNVKSDDMFGDFGTSTSVTTKQSSFDQNLNNIDKDGNAKGKLEKITSQQSDNFAWENHFYSGSKNIDELRGKPKDQFDSQFKDISASKVNPFSSTTNWK